MSMTVLAEIASSSRLRKPLGLRQPAEDRFHHDDGGIDDQAEIDRADRQQVGRFAAQHQDADGKEQRERNGRADDQARCAGRRGISTAAARSGRCRRPCSPARSGSWSRSGPCGRRCARYARRAAGWSELLIRSTSCSTRAIVGELCSPRRISTMPWTISSSWFSPAMPSRGCSADRRRSRRP